MAVNESEEERCFWDLVALGWVSKIWVVAKECNIWASEMDSPLPPTSPNKRWYMFEAWAVARGDHSVILAPPILGYDYTPMVSYFPTCDEEFICFEREDRAKAFLESKK